MVGTSTHQKKYQQEGKLLEPEEASHMTGSHDTQLIDLTTEEPAALVKLASNMPTGKICPSHTMSTGVDRADRHFTGRVDLQAGDEGKEIPLRACTTKAGTVETLHHNGNLTDEQALKNQTSATYRSGYLRKTFT
jgi:hypothetical protein